MSVTDPPPEPSERPAATDAPTANSDAFEPAGDPFAARLPPGSSPTAGLDAVLPVAIFLGFNRFFGLAWAIVGATVWSIWSLIKRRRSGIPIGRFLPAVIVLIIGRGIIGLLTDSETIYFGLGVASKYAIGLGLLISALIGKNIVARLAPYAFGFGPAVTGTPSYQSATARITIIGGLYYLASASFDIWLLATGGDDNANRYLLTRTGVNWVASTVILLGCALYLAKRLKEIEGFPGLMPLFEQRVEQQAASMGWDISDPDGAVHRIPKADRLQQRHSERDT